MLVLLKLKEIYACTNHFDYDWIKVRGGKRLNVPPLMFPGVPQSCLKQIPSLPRKTLVSAENKQLYIKTMGKIGAFLSFCDAIMKQFLKHYIICNNGDICFPKTDAKRCFVIQFIHFQQVHSTFGFLHSVSVEKNKEKCLRFTFQKKVVCKKNSLIFR